MGEGKRKGLNSAPSISQLKGRDLDDFILNFTGKKICMDWACRCTVVMESGLAFPLAQGQETADRSPWGSSLPTSRGAA